MLSQCCARSFKHVAVRNARRAHRLACPASETSRNVCLDAITRRLEGRLEQRAHEHDAAAWTVVLILECQICRTLLKTESTMHACVDSRLLLRKRAIGK